MKTDEPTHASASWSQLEHAIERMHAAARTATSVVGFYRQLLAEALPTLGASGGAAWRTDGGIERLCQALDDIDERAVPDPLIRRQWVRDAVSAGEAIVRAPAASNAADRGRDSGPAVVLCAVRRPGVDRADVVNDQAAAVIEIWFPKRAASAVERGWLDFAETLADVAADFHALEELRRLREGAELHRHAVDLLRRVGRPRTFAGAAFETANEGRRLLGCDRLSLVVRRGRSWRLVSTSGVDRADRRTDFARRTERLADQAARWGEPISSPAVDADDSGSPPPLAAAIEEHVDHSHARAMACAPFKFTPAASADADSSPPRSRRRRAHADFVLVAESFEANDQAALMRRLVELGELCAPALARAAQLDHFPVRTLLGASERLAALARPARFLRMLFIVGALAGAVAALALVRAPLDVEAPATLVAAVEREVFASATGSVAEVRVEHGQKVAAGDVLIVLNDPELSLELQQTRGEIDAARKRLDALAIARTERNASEKLSDDRLPLSAEEQQLKERLASLEGERQLLEDRQQALTLRSPLAGIVLTRDVQKLLESRPVERGQSLLSVADLSQGWEIVAETPEREIARVLAAQSDAAAPLSATYRLAGDVKQSFPGHVTKVSAAAALEPDALEDETPPVEVRIALDGEPPAAARPGMTASVRIHCGERSLGYVWLHDVGATLYRWATF